MAICDLEILTMVSEVGMQISGAFESIPDLLELCTTDVVIEDLLSHLI